MSKQVTKSATQAAAPKPVATNTMIAVPLWINAAASVYGNLVAKLWDTEKLIVGHTHEAEIPEEFLRKAAEETRRSMQYFGEEFGLLKKKDR
jgi:hypothetical protein